MPPRHRRLFVADIVDAEIKNLAVIGEAARRVPASVMEAHPEVPWSKMSELTGWGESIEPPIEAPAL